MIAPQAKAPPQVYSGIQQSVELFTATDAKDAKVKEKLNLFTARDAKNAKVKEKLNPQFPLRPLRPLRLSCLTDC
jgi:hypothetical protein